MGNLYHTTGSVGIGTTAPLVPLDVRGGSVRVNRDGSFEQSIPSPGSWARGLFFVDGTAVGSLEGRTGGIGMYRSGAAASTTLFMGWGDTPWVSPLGIHVLQNPLTVGIGTPSPTVKLDVNGGVNVSGTLSVDETSGFTAGNISCSSNIEYTDIGYQGITIASHTATSGPRYASANFSHSAPVGMNSNATVGVTVNGKLVVITGIITNVSTTASPANTVIIKGLPKPRVYNLFVGEGPRTLESGAVTFNRFDIDTNGDMNIQFAWTGSARNATSNYGTSILNISCYYFTA